MNNINRFTYCSHNEEWHVPEDRPIITRDDLEAAWMEVHSKTDIAWDAFIEQFEAEQPGLRHLLFGIHWPFSQKAHSEWQLQILTVWRAFRARYSGLRPVTKQEIFSLMPVLQPEFARPELCLCLHHQFQAMRGIIQRLEHAIDQEELTVMEGNQLIKNMVLIIESLDRFGTGAEPQKALTPDVDAAADMSLDPVAGEEDKQN